VTVAGAAQEPQSGRGASGVLIRALEQRDLDEADRVTRLAFGTFLGLPDPLSVFGDAEIVRPRFAAEPSWAFVAELDGAVVGSNFATRWGSFGFFGPLSVRPDLWDRGIAQALMAPIVDLFDGWELRGAGLFTFAQSPKHVGLYQRFGFWPQHLTAVMARPVVRGAAAQGGHTRYSQIPDAQRDGVLERCRELTGAIYDGLDLAHEIRAADAQALGDTVLLLEDSAIVGLAVAHCGAGEAGSGACFIKFAGVRPGADSGERFEALLGACEQLAGEQGAERIVGGVSVARRDAHRRLIARGYRTQFQGVRMQRPDEPGYCRPDRHVIDDLR
jgi:predicted N-acetyltransferase YhbS